MAGEGTRGGNEHSGESREQRDRQRERVIDAAQPRQAAAKGLPGCSTIPATESEEKCTITAARRAALPPNACHTLGERGSCAAASLRRCAMGLRESPLPAALFAADPPPLLLLLLLSGSLVLGGGGQHRHWGHPCSPGAARLQQQYPSTPPPHPSVGAFHFAAGARSRSPRSLL